jgi:hypothetical protein
MQVGDLLYFFLHYASPCQSDYSSQPEMLVVVVVLVVVLMVVVVEQQQQY